MIKVDFRPLYEDGLTDREIARQVGCCWETVRAWRNKSGLPTVLRAKREKLWQEGFSDAEIARQTGYTPQGIRKWRKKLGRKPHGKPFGRA